MIGNKYAERRGCNDMTFSGASHGGFKPVPQIYVNGFGHSSTDA